MSIEALLLVIAVLLLMMLWKLSNIDSRLKNRFPTEKEQDYERSQKRPDGTLGSIQRRQALSRYDPCSWSLFQCTQTIEQRRILVNCFQHFLGELNANFHLLLADFVVLFALDVSSVVT